MTSRKTVKRESRKTPRKSSTPAAPNSSSRENDEYFLHRALELARKGIRLTSPNPCVGAVVEDMQDRGLGEGIHTFEGIKHAEVLALERAGEKARGATLY